MKVRFGVCSDNVALDMNTNRLSVFHIMESVVVATVPFIIPRMSISYILEKERDSENSSRADIRLHIGGTTIATIPISIDFQGQKMCRHMAHLNGLIIPTYGLLNVELSHNNKPIGNCVIDIMDIDYKMPETGNLFSERPAAANNPSKPEKSKRSKTPAPDPNTGRR